MAQIIQFPLPDNPAFELSEAIELVEAFAKIKDRYARYGLIQTVKQMADPAPDAHPAMGGDLHGEWTPQTPRRPQLVKP